MVVAVVVEDDDRLKPPTEGTFGAHLYREVQGNSLSLWQRYLFIYTLRHRAQKKAKLSVVIGIRRRGQGLLPRRTGGPTSRAKNVKGDPGIPVRSS